MAAKILKQHQERKNKILDAAQELFIRDGYQSTPVNAVIERVGISKGTFYHYFNSKDELLDTMVGRLTAVILDQIKAAIQDGQMDAVTKLNTFFRVSGRWKAANRDVILMLVKALYCDDNILLRDRTSREMIATTAPLLGEIIKQGIAEGVFDTPNPDEAARLLLSIGIAMREVTAKLLVELQKNPEVWSTIEAKVATYEDAVERILGAPRGSIHIAAKGMMEAFRQQGGVE